MTQNGRYNPQILKNKSRLSGEEAGILMIYDLIETYRSILEGTGGVGLLSSVRKNEIVSALSGDENIRHYTELKLTHDYLASVPTAYESYAKTAEVYFCKAYRQLSDFLHAEQENLRDLARPAVMYAQEYRLTAARVSDNLAKAYPNGIAVIAGNTELEKYTEPPVPVWRTTSMAERFISDGAEQLAENLSGIVHMTRQCIARKSVLSLIGSFIGVPEVNILIPEPDVSDIVTINSLVDEIHTTVKRFSAEETSHIRSELKHKLRHIDPSKLFPSAAAIHRAADSVCYAVFQGGMENIVAQLASSVE